MKCRFELWFHGNRRVPKPQDWEQSWTISENSHEELSLHVSRLLVLWLPSAFDSTLEPRTSCRPFSSQLLLIDLQLLPSSLSSGKPVVRRKRQRGLTEKAHVWCQTDLRGSTTYQMHDPRLGFSGRWKMEPINPVLQGCLCWEDKWKLHVKWGAPCLAHSKHSVNGSSL